MDALLHGTNATPYKTPTSQQVDVTLQRIRMFEFATYFFSRLENPSWISPLSEHGVFASPPPPERIEGGGVRYPRWPASQYLARMAAHTPQEVADIFSKIRTENPPVVGDVLAAANTAEMAPDAVARLVPTICEAIKANALWAYFPRATEVCVRLATGGEKDAAMTLAEALYGLRYPASGDRDHYWYKEGLKKVVPVLTKAGKELFLGRLCQWLCTAIENRDHLAPTAGADYSWSWRPAIEDHEQNSIYDLASEMVGFVRQAFEQAIDDGLLMLVAGLAVVDAVGTESGFLVFERLRIHLINRFADRAPELAVSTMMERQMFDTSEVKHEYAMLMGQRFPMLSTKDRETWLGWIDAGPDLSDFDAYFTSNMGRGPSADERQGRICFWQFNRLHWIKDHLSGDWLDFYKRMVAKEGEPRLADLNAYHSMRWGAESPFTVEELGSLPFGDALSKIATWQPGPSRASLVQPDIEGLAHAFGQYVGSKAVEFSTHAELLEGHKPIYVRTFLAKMTEALHAAEIDVSAVLRLCRWVVEQPLERGSNDEEATPGSVDGGWQWVRDEICQFLETMCKAVSGDGSRYSLSDHRETIRDLLEPLSRAPARSYILDCAERENPRTYDFLTSAINSPRGKAVEALTAYARWVAQDAQQDEAGRKIVPNGFGAMPEVMAILDWQIAAENATFEASAIIGDCISLLCWIDPSWVRENASKIFDLSTIEQGPAQAFGWAAWNAFLTWNHPRFDLYDMLRAQYSYAVEHLPDAKLPPNAGTTPLHHLGEHLIILYGRGQLTTDEVERLVHGFLRGAPPDVRSQTIAFVGQTFRDNEEGREAIVRRFQELWDWYWLALGRLDTEARPKCGFFPAWFASKQFPDEWCISRIEDILGVAPLLYDGKEILERLAEVVDAHLGAAVRILDRMIRADQEGDMAYIWREPAERILRSAMHGDEAVRRMASRLIDYLGRRGYVEYGELLREMTSL